MSRASDGTGCPVCNREYDQRIVVERGDRWGDIFAGTPFSFFRRYHRRCTSRHDAEEETTLPDDQRAVYFHGGGGGLNVF